MRKIHKSISIRKCYSILFYHLKKLLYYLYHTILQYLQHPKTLLFYHFIKILFFKSRSKHKNSFLVWLCSACAHFLSLSCPTSLLLIWVWLCSDLCSGCGSWVVDREFVIWVSPCSMVVIRWIFGFHRAQWHHHFGFAVLDGVAVLSIWWIFGFHHVGFDPVVIWVFWVSPCSVVLGWLCCGLLCCGLAVLVKLQRWRRRVGFALDYIFDSIQNIKSMLLSFSY